MTLILEQKKRMSDDEWNRLVDRYMSVHNMTVDDYEQLGTYQIYFIQTLKKHFKRVNKKEICVVHHSFSSKING
jgi:hypothetical protein